MGVCLRDLRPGGVRIAAVRFYFDADILGLGKLLATLRSDVTYPGDPGSVLHRSTRPPCPITTPHTRDLDWIPWWREPGGSPSPGTATSRTTEASWPRCGTTAFVWWPSRLPKPARPGNSSK